METKHEHLWFKRKLYGWGWTPVTWQGWIVTVLYVAGVILSALTITDHSSVTEVSINFGIPVLLLSIMFVGIAYKKGEKPRWQWGKRIED